MELVEILRQSRNHEFLIKRVAEKSGVPQTIASSIRNFLDIPAKWHVKAVRKFMATECSGLARHKSDMDALMNPALVLYLALGHKIVDLTAYLSYCPTELKYEYLKMAVIKIADVSPDIEELLLRTRVPYMFRIYRSEADAEFLEALKKLTRLNVLQLDEWCCFDPEDLFDLCSNLPSLQYLSIIFHDSLDNSIDQEIFAQKIKGSMRNLREFLYYSLKCSCIGPLCALNLPNLQTVQNYPPFCPEVFDAPVSSDSDQCLLRLHFDMDDAFENMHLELPQVKDIEIRWSSDEDYVKGWKHLLHFSHIASLNLIDLPSEPLRCFLDTYGLNIRSLSIHKLHATEKTEMVLSEMLAACPRLEKLRLDIDINNTEPITFFAQLKEVDVSLNSYSEKREEVLNLLHAPNLEKVTLHCDWLNANDLKKLMAAVADKKILRNVTTLVLAIQECSFGELCDYKDDFVEMIKFIICAVDSLPKLKGVKFYLSLYRCEYSVLARSLRDGKTSNDEIPFVSEFFEGINFDTFNAEWFIDEELIYILDKYSFNEYFGRKMKTMFNMLQFM